jgi:hypothetical protein
MNRALVLLARLRQVGGLRAFWRSGRGSPIALLGKALVLFIFLGTALGWVSGIVFILATARNGILQSSLEPLVGKAARAAPFALLAFLVFLLSLSALEKPFGFSPAEENFLIAGPFDRRQLLNYKIGTGLLGALVMALLAAPMGTAVSPLVSVFVGSLLLFGFFRLASLIAGQLGSLTGMNGPGSVRRLGIVLVVIAGALAAVWGTYGESLNDPVGLYRLAGRSPGLRMAMSPFRWFVEAILAKHIWPDLVRPSSLCLAVNAALLATVYGLDARLQRRDDAEDEGRAANSESQRPARVRARRALPAFARCGGAGPIAWRQAMIAVRKPQQLGIIILMYFTLLSFLFLIIRTDTGIVFIRNFDGSTEINPVGARLIGALAVTLAIFIASGISFDFRGDMGQMDVLKAFPAGPLAVTAGQVFVPVVIASAMQWLTLLVVVIALRRLPPGLWAAAVFVPPVSVLVIAVENLPGFWFPMRPRQDLKPEPFEMVGHVLLHPILRMAGYATAAGTTVLVSAAAYFLSGQSFLAAVVAAWFTLAVGGIGLIALLARAFDTFDVSRDAPIH